MKEELRQAVAWTRPKLVKVGTIQDVANSQIAGPQGGGVKS